MTKTKEENKNKEIKLVVFWVVIRVNFYPSAYE